MSQTTVTSSSIVSLPTGEQSQLRAWMDTIGTDAKQPFALVRILGAHNQARTQLMEAIESKLIAFGAQLSMKPGNISRMFETFIEDMRTTILDAVLASSGIPLSDFHAVFGIVHKGNVLLAGCGKLQVIFLHQTAKKRYTVYQLNDHFGDHHNGTISGWNTILKNILDGELGTGDIFYLATRVHEHALSQDELQNILVQLPIAGALKRILQHVGANTAYGAIGLKVKELSEKPTIKQNPLTSMEHLKQTQSSTAQVLGDQVPDVQSAVKRLTKKLSTYFTSTGKRDAVSVMKRIIQSLIFGVQAFALAIVPKKQPKVPEQEAPMTQRAITTINETRIAFVATAVKFFSTALQLPKWQKITATIAFFGLFVLILFSATSTQREQSQETFASAEIILERIEEKITASNATLSYDNDDQARQLIEEAKVLFATLPSIKKLEDRESELRSKIAETELKLRKVVAINPEQIAELTGAPVSLTWNEDTITLIGTGIFGRYTNNELTILSSETPSASSATPWNQDALVLSSGSLLRVAPNGIQTPVISGIKPERETVAVHSYNDTLYALMPSAEQIVRMRPLGDQFEAGTNWIIDKQSTLNTAKDFAIDGNIYLLTDEGILLFASGREQSLEEAVISPSIKTATSIITYPELDALLVLDSANKRIVRFDKTGKLIAQYEHDALQDATAFTVSRDGTQIFFTTNSGLFQIML